MAVLFHLLAWVATIARAKHGAGIDFAVSDAQGYYVYLPSLLIDHDVDFQNQMRVQARLDGLGDDAALRGANILRHNRWPIGVALSLSPVFLLAHGATIAIYHLTGSAAFEPNGYTLLYQASAVAAVMVLGLAMMVLVDDLVVRRFAISGRSAALGVICFWAGSNYAYYYFREPLMCHVISAYWVMATLWLIDHILTDLDKGRVGPLRWGLLIGAVSMAIVCRLTNFFVAPFLIYLAWRVIRERRIFAILKAAPVMAPFLFPLITQLFVWRAMNGSIFQTSVSGLGYESNERFYWTQPALWQTLLSGRHGLFFWSPTLLVAAWGIALLARQGKWRDPWLGGALLSAATLWYVCSCWWSWGFGWSFGAREFLELSPVFILGFAAAFERLPEMGDGSRRAVFAFLIAAIVYQYVMMGLYITFRISRSDYPWATNDREHFAVYRDADITKEAVPVPK